MTFSGETIWIIGASSGIGEALARELASQGATLILSARSQDALMQLNQALGGQHDVLPLDVADSEAVKRAAQQVQQRHQRLDRTIFMAAIYKPADINARDYAFTKQLIDVNLTGAFNVTYALLGLCEEQKSGQIVLCASVAGYVGLPGGQPYSATKAAILNLAESLHAEAPDYVDVKVICPGFVRTRMTNKNNFPMPMRMEPEGAAIAIADGLNKRGFEIHFPKAFTFGLKFLRFLPYRLSLWITRQMRGKAT